VSTRFRSPATHATRSGADDDDIHIGKVMGALYSRNRAVCAARLSTGLGYHYGSVRLLQLLKCSVWHLTAADVVCH
jgi:hypothetical protein